MNTHELAWAEPFTTTLSSSANSNHEKYTPNCPSNTFQVLPKGSFRLRVGLYM